jgi:ankyrin repeat protein
VKRLIIFLLFVFLTCTTFAQISDQERLFAAIGKRDAASVDALLKKDRALLKTRSDDMSPVLEALFLLDKSGFMNTKDNKTLAVVLSHKPELDLYEACGVGDAARVSELLRADRSRATSWSGMGWTPLHYAAFGGNAEVVKILLREGATVHLNARAKTRFRNTPLQAALLSAQYDTTKVLLENGADVLIRQSKGFTPLHAAAEAGRKDLIDLLLQHGAEINSRTDDGRNAYTEALRFGERETAEYLKAKGATDGKITIDLTKEPD